MLKWLSILLILILSCGPKKEDKPQSKEAFILPEKACFHYPTVITCGFEQVEKDFFLTDSTHLKFNWGQLQSPNQSYSGKYSIQHQNNEVSPSLSLEVNNGDQIRVSVKRKQGTKSKLVVHTKDGQTFSRNWGEKAKNDWVNLSLEFPALSQNKTSHLKIHLKKDPKDEVVFWDDLKIEIFSKNSQIPHPNYSNALNLNISETDLKEMENTRNNELNSGIISKNSKKWIKVNANWNGKLIEGKLKIKGDWTEHLFFDKWGVKLKLTDPIFDTKKFSIMKPSSRSFLREFVLHKILESQGIITTKFSFIPVEINKQSKGLFAYEEHFTKALLKRQHLKLAPIIKICEDSLWAGRKASFWENKYLPEEQKNWLINEEISNYIKSATLGEINQAKELLDGFRKGELTLKECFDIDYQAKAMALTSVLRANHSWVWHNTRFYFDPKSKKLKSIIYDGYSHDNHLPPKGYVGDRIEHYEKPWLSLFLSSEEFRIAYKAYLIQFNSISFIKEELNKISEKLSHYEKLIQLEYCDYQFRSDYILENIKTINSSINNLDSIPLSLN